VFQEFNIDRLPRLPFNFEKLMNLSLSFGVYEDKESTLLQSNYIPDITCFGCPVNCSECCNDTILMSYCEYNLILYHLTTTWNKERLFHLYSKRLGLLNPQTKSLICPFSNLLASSNEKHCSIYQARPWICRSFGTNGSLCNKINNINIITQNDFDFVTSKLIYRGKSIRLNNNFSLLMGTFDMWVIADSEKANALKLFSLIKDKSLNLMSKLYDINKRQILTIKHGKTLNAQNI